MIVYVSPDGCDTDDGTQDKPLATLTAARNRLRSAPTGVEKQIVVRGGKYYDASLELGPDDSGLVVKSAPGERPVLQGGRPITGWQKDGERFYSAPLPKIDGSVWEPTTLVINGQMANRSRLPASGTLEHLSRFDVPNLKTYEAQERQKADGLPFCLWKRRPTIEEVTTLKYRPGELGEWLDINNAGITVYHLWDESSVRLAGHDPKTQTLTFASQAVNPPGSFGIRKYVVWNIRQGMNQPGQWYLDRTAGRVVYWPRPGEDMSSVEAIGSTRDTIISLKGASEKPVRDVTISGLVLTVTNRYLDIGGFAAVHARGALEAVFAEGCRVTGLDVHNVGGTGIRSRLERDAEIAATDLKIERCHVHHCGAGGVYVAGSNCVVTDCRIHDIGIVLPSAMGIWAGSKSTACSHNELYDMPYIGIGFHGDGILIEANRICRVMSLLADGAAIYGLGKANIVRGNHVSDLPDKWGCSSYYFDEIAEDCVLEGNLSVGVASPSHNHVTRNLTIRNNVFVSDGDLQMTFPHSEGYSLKRNVIVAVGKIGIQAPRKLLRAMPNNVFFSRSGRKPVETVRDTLLRLKDGSVFADPLFRNAADGDYSFQPGSPTVGLGIKPFDLSGVGPRKSKVKGSRVASGGNK